LELGWRQGGAYGKINLVAGHQYRFRVEYFPGGGNDDIQLSWLVPAASRPAEIRCDTEGRQLEIVASQPGHYELTVRERQGVARKNQKRAHAPGNYRCVGGEFPAQWGAPGQITLDHLISLSDSTNSGVKYFSGTATYTKTFDWSRPGPVNKRPKPGSISARSR
jgi:hypothetical protein